MAVARISVARYGRRSFSVSGLLLWNSLPLTVRHVSLTLTQFCAWLKTFSFPDSLREPVSLRDIIAPLWQFRL